MDAIETQPGESTTTPPPGGDTSTATTANPNPAAAAAAAPRDTNGNMIPLPRFQEVNRERKQYYDESIQARAEADHLRRQVEALTGVKHEQAVSPEEQQVRDAILRMFPHLGALGKLTPDQLATLLERIPQLGEQVEERQKQDHARLADQTLSRLYTDAKSIFQVPAGQELGQKQRAFLHAGFVGWIEQNNLAGRYVSGDEGLVREYLKTLADDIIGPVRRSSAVTQGSRLRDVSRVPTGGSGSPAGTPPASLPKDPDKLLDAAASAYFSRRG